MASVTPLELKLKLAIASAPDRKYKTGNTLFFQGEVPSSAVYIRNGLVAAYTINNNGDEQIVNLFSDGDLLPCEWIFGKSPVSLYYYRAFEDCDVTLLKKEDLLGFIGEQSPLISSIIDQYVKSFIASNIHIHALEHSHSRDKLIKIFHYLVMRFGKVLPDGRYEVPINITHSQLASMLGLSRETVTTELQKIKRSKALVFKDRHYIINLPELIRSSGGEEYDALAL